MIDTITIHIIQRLSDLAYLYFRFVEKINNDNRKGQGNVQ